MPVRLDKVPGPAARPTRIRFWRWLVGLLPCLALGLGLTLWRGGESLEQQPLKFWMVALGLPFLVWFVLAGLRLLAYWGANAAANGWDQARAQELSKMMRRGRRSQQVLAVSLRTALGAGEMQRSALFKGQTALRAQTSWQELSARHSRLAVDEALPLVERLSEQLVAVLQELAVTLEKFPADRPLALVLETSSAIAEQQLVEVWTEAWRSSGIRQTTTRLKGTGLAVIDHWLDRRIDDQALLLVVAYQFAPESVEGSAETVVGFLFGNRLTQLAITPVAYLHRPEAVDSAAEEPLSKALLQALEWVPLAPSEIAGVWKAGSDASANRLITQALDRAGMPVSVAAGLHDIDVALGHAGCAAPWLAIAAATESIQDGAGPQFICSGEGSEGVWSWCSVVMPPDV